MTIEWISPDEIRPYPGNPRKNNKAVDAVAASIKEYGFNSPIILQPDGTIINGHTRWKAAKKLNLEKVPCIRVSDLTEEQIRQYRIIDNKTSEIAQWDKDKLMAELEGLDFGQLDFNFDFADDIKTGGWGAERIEIPCNLTEAKQNKCTAGYYHAIYDTDGGTLDGVKTPENVQIFADAVIRHITGLIGGLGDTWCVMTTPRRRHGEGFHFATEVSKRIAEAYNIRFYPDAIKCRSKHRVGAVFDLIECPEEQNVLLYDDIITTGETLRASKAALT